MNRFTEVDVMKMIKDLASSYADDNKAQGKMVQLLKGLAFSDDPKANEFMKALDAWTTTQSKKMSGKKEAVSVEITEEFQIPGTDVILEKGDSIFIEEEVAGWIAMYNGKELEILKGTGSGEATSLYGAKTLAIKLMKVPKSKVGFLAIAPAS